MSIGSIVNEYENSVFRETYSGLAGISSSFEDFLMEREQQHYLRGTDHHALPGGR